MTIAALTLIAIAVALYAGYRAGLYIALLRIYVGSNRNLTPAERATLDRLMDRSLGIDELPGMED